MNLYAPNKITSKYTTQKQNYKEKNEQYRNIVRDFNKLQLETVYQADKISLTYESF